MANMQKEINKGDNHHNNSQANTNSEGEQQLAGNENNLEYSMNQNSNNTNSNNTTNNNVYILNGFGHEDISHLTKKELDEIFSHGVNCIGRLHQAIHYHPKNSKNHNIYSENKTSRLVCVFNEILRRWELVEREWLNNKSKDLLVRNYVAKKVEQMKPNQKGYTGLNNIVEHQHDAEYEKMMKESINEVNYACRRLGKKSMRKVQKLEDAEIDRLEMVPKKMKSEESSAAN